MSTSANDQIGASSAEALEWNKDQIRSLRLRLGWSQSELARRLSCTTAEVDSFERGHCEITHIVVNELVILAKCADACRDETQALPRAESVCDQKALGQIDFSELTKDIE